jgi:Uma2 family endonuclease
MAITQRRMTLAEFLELPEEEPALEYEAGVVKQKVSPKAPHSRLQFWLCRLFDSTDSPSKQAAAFPEARVTLAGSSLVPDLVVYRWEHIPREASGRVVADFTTPPDIAVEILSPELGRATYEQRCRWYVEQGVEIALLVNPRNESVQIFRRGQQPSLLRGHNPISLDPVLPGLRLAVRDLFSALWLGR